MKELAKYSGAIFMLIGVLVLAIPFFQGTTNNTSLIIGMLLIVEGFLGHIYVNNMKKGSLVGNIIWAVLLLIVPFVIFLMAKKMAYDRDEYALYNE